MTAVCQESPNAVGRRRLLSRPHEPLFLADWDRALMLHFAVESDSLQRVVPFPLDLRDGQAFVSLVAFTMRRMRLRIGGRIGEWLCAPIATHPFLNVRAYVEHKDEPGIYFMTEWLPNRLSVALGPGTFGLPYRFGRLEYAHPALQTGSADDTALRGCVSDSVGRNFAYTGRLVSGAEPSACESGSLDEWLMERYTAFTCAREVPRFFRVWHPPWKQVPAEIELRDMRLLENTWKCFRDAHLAGANYSPGVSDV